MYDGYHPDVTIEIGWILGGFANLDVVADAEARTRVNK